MDDANVHIKADLTFKQSRIAVTPPLWGKEQTEYRTFISESVAYANVEQFASRLNYRIYKNAFRRFNKKLTMIAAVEGGRVEMRDTITDRGRDKRFHTHLLIEMPSFKYLREGKHRIPFNEQVFMEIIEQEWTYFFFGFKTPTSKPSWKQRENTLSATFSMMFTQNMNVLFSLLSSIALLSTR